MSIPEKPFRLQIDRRTLEPHLTEDEVIYWALRTLKIKAGSRVNALRPALGLDWELKLSDNDETASDEAAK